MQKRIEAVLFDLDGTLTDTLEDIAAAMNDALASFGLPLWPTDSYRFLVGDGALRLAERAVRDRQDLRDAVRAAYQARYETHSQIRTRPYEGIPDLLNALERASIPMVVFSNKPDADTRAIVSHYFPRIPFAAVVGQKPGVPVKPDPEGALRIADSLGIPPARFAYLGDTYVDMRCALRAGMHPLGVTWGFRTAEELLASGAEALLQKPADLLPFLNLPVSQT